MSHRFWRSIVVTHRGQPAKQFVTAGGVVVPAITADQMRDVDRIAIEGSGPNLYQMMENAGRSLAQKAITMLGETRRDSVVLVLAGIGGNGGGGICAARHLANRGIDVRLVISDESRLSGVPANQLSVYRATRGQLGTSADVGDVEASLVVDALIGYSLNGAPRGASLELIDWVSTTDSPVLSLDVPSGVDSTTGENSGPHVKAAETLTLALPKSGLNVEAVGLLSLADIGIPHQVYQRAEIEVPGDLFGDQWVVPVQAR